ncbi:MAG TPA: hypothetical protein VHG28_20270 [Longimicrobiaceae bacterium]|nr:hypothetical protein [Longimicrobiaceae bacterium]
MRYTRHPALLLFLPAIVAMGLVACSDRGPDSPLAPSSTQPRYDSSAQSDSTGRSGYIIGGNSTGETTTADTTSTERSGYTIGGN